jgi:hypothetical protein
MGPIKVVFKFLILADAIHSFDLGIGRQFFACSKHISDATKCDFFLFTDAGPTSTVAIPTPASHRGRGGQHARGRASSQGTAQRGRGRGRGKTRTEYEFPS